VLVGGEEERVVKCIDLWPNSFCPRSPVGPRSVQPAAVCRGVKSFLQSTCWTANLSQSFHTLLIFIYLNECTLLYKDFSMLVEHLLEISVCYLSARANSMTSLRVFALFKCFLLRSLKKYCEFWYSQHIYLYIICICVCVYICIYFSSKYEQNLFFQKIFSTNILYIFKDNICYFYYS